MESCNDATKKIAVKYFEQAIGGGSLDAVKVYSNYLIKGKIIPQDLDKAKKILENRLKDHDETVQFLYGKILKKEKKSGLCIDPLR